MPVPETHVSSLLIGHHVLQQNLRSLSADVRQLPGFAGSAGQGGVLTARDLLFPDSFAEAYQLDADSSQGLTLNPAFLSVRAFLHHNGVSE